MAGNTLGSGQTKGVMGRIPKSHPRTGPPTRKSGKTDMILHCDDIEGALPAKPWAGVERNPNDVTDIPGAQADTVRIRMKTTRCTNPLNPEYTPLDYGECVNDEPQMTTQKPSAEPTDKTTAEATEKVNETATQKVIGEKVAKEKTLAETGEQSVENMEKLENKKTGKAETILAINKSVGRHPKTAPRSGSSSRRKQSQDLSATIPGVAGSRPHSTPH
eukprot:813385_1